MDLSTARNALATVVLALTGVLLIAAGFFAAIIVLDNRGEATPATVADVPATPTSAPAAAGRSEIHSGLIDEIIAILKKQFVKPELVDRPALIEAAINGIFTELGDPHLTYIDPPTFAVLRADVRGAFQGIGATIARRHNFVVIVQPLPGTPAERAGIRAGDIILEIDGESTEGWSVRDIPVAILQDEFSASGSELLAAALQENGRAIVVGAPSFGKGTVSQAVELSNGGAVYVSIARWLTPDRNLIEGRGVIPDIEVELTVEDIEARRDVALHRAIDALRAQVVARTALSV